MSHNTAVAPGSTTIARFTTLGKVALAGALATSALAITDLLVVGFTGQGSFGSDANAGSPLWLVGGLAHGLTYALLAGLLVTEARRIDAGGRFRKLSRWILAASFGLLVPYFVAGSLWVVATDAEVESVAAVFAVPIGVGFGGMFLGSLLLGIALWRAPDLRPASRMMSVGVLAAIGLTVVLGVFASDFAHPAIAEAAVYVGAALVGLRSNR